MMSGLRSIKQTHKIFKIKHNVPQLCVGGDFEIQNCQNLIT